MITTTIKNEKEFMKYVTLFLDALDAQCDIDITTDIIIRKKINYN